MHGATAPRSPARGHHPLRKRRPRAGRYAVEAAVGKPGAGRTEVLDSNDFTVVPRLTRARCVLMLTQRLSWPLTSSPAVPLARRPSSPSSPRRARNGGEPRSRFMAEHRALLRRLGADDPALHVPMLYERLCDAFAAGELDIAPDYGASRPVTGGRRGRDST